MFRSARVPWSSARVLLPGVVDVRDGAGVDADPVDPGTIGQCQDILGEPVGVGVEQVGAEAVDDQPGLGLGAGLQVARPAGARRRLGTTSVRDGR